MRRLPLGILVGIFALLILIASQCGSFPTSGSLDSGLDAQADKISEAGSPDIEADGALCVASPKVGSLRPIPAGTFLVGSPLTEWGRGPFDQDQVQVSLTHPIEIGATELTQAEWTSLCVTNPSGKDKAGVEDCLDPDCPVGGVTWFDAVGWLNKLSETRGLPPCYRMNDCTGVVGTKMTCKSVDVLASSVYACEGYRLATEFEFEYAARSETTTAFYSGDITPVPGDPDTCIYDANLDPIAWYCANSGLVTHRVAQKLPNAWGLYDMIGNSLEWTHSKYTGSGYGSAPSSIRPAPRQPLSMAIRHRCGAASTTIHRAQLVPHGAARLPTGVAEPAADSASPARFPFPIPAHPIVEVNRVDSAALSRSAS